MRIFSYKFNRIFRNNFDILNGIIGDNKKVLSFFERLVGIHEAEVFSVW